ncbi:DUF6364 family protein [Arhodomonas sp. AD133]|uniref:DUF6364 family protein n=1 Tax=Arhodomonas sp. AD133 TaxID=3415009 RepID=UPI003EB6DD73
MGDKLTLRVDEELINRAKRYSRAHGITVSQLVAEYFALLQNGTDNEEHTWPPITRSLYGALKGANVSRDDYRAHLERKYLGD